MCQDILASETSRVGSKTNQARVKEIVKEIVQRELGKIKGGKIKENIKKETAAILETAVVQTFKAI
jgi:hypothetical protein